MNEMSWMMLSMGFLGGLHCLGMCGGLVSALSLSRSQIFWRGLWVYQFGRVMTYTILGLVTGMLGASLTAMVGSAIQQAFAIFAGIAMLFFGLNLAGLLPDMLHKVSKQASQRLGLSKLVYSLAQDVRVRGWLMMGLINGLLPCGLVYAALSLALSAESILTASLYMLLFGVGTIPAMLFAPTLLHRITPRRRGLFLRLAGVLVIVMAVMVLMRGGGMVNKHNSSHLMSSVTILDLKNEVLLAPLQSILLARQVADNPSE